MSAPVKLPEAPPAEPEVRLTGDKRRFSVEGMDCASCAQTVRKKVEALADVDGAEVSFGSATMEVLGRASDESIVSAVRGAGFSAAPADRSSELRRIPFWRNARTLSTVASIPFLIVAVVGSLAGAPEAPVTFGYIATIVIGGWPIARAAVASLSVRALDMNVLMTLAAIGAVGIGAYAEGAWVLVLFAIGTTLETFALDRTRRAVGALMELAPDEACVRDADGTEKVMPADEVRVGDQVIVRPGERVPLDGKVSAGYSGIDQSPITGESVPVDVGPDSEVFAGTLALEGMLTVEVAKVASESTLSKIAALVEDAQGSKAPSERFVDRFARVYTPLVFGAALALVLLPPLLFGGVWDTWIYRGLALLIVACPCSLVISVPVAVVSAIGGAAREGVLITGGQALEDLGNIDTVAIDKTGTLTLGEPALEEVVLFDDGLSRQDAIRMMATVENGSEHPLGRAVVRAAREQGIGLGEPTAFHALPGRGVEALVDGRSLWAGGPRMTEERLGLVPREAEHINRRGQTAMFLGEGSDLLAMFGVADQVRSEASRAMAGLKAVGISNTVMLTGDSEPVAREVSSRTGVEAWQAGLLPEDKLDAIRQMQAGGSTVAMVGDGVNDAPALALADVGVAMGSAGSDIALWSSDVALMSDDLERLPEAVSRARSARQVMRLNVIVSLVAKGLFVLLTPFGLVTLVLAVAVDMGMSLIVTLNALRLLRRSSPVQDAPTPRVA